MPEALAFRSLSRRQDWAYFGVALAGCLLAFQQLPWLMFLGLGALSVVSRHGCYRQKMARLLLWGAFYSGLFHLWLLRSDPVLWFVGLLPRSSVWLLLLLPSFLLSRLFSRKELSAYLYAGSWGAGLFLVVWAQLSTPLGFDWEVPLAALAGTPILLSLLPWLGLPGLSGLLGAVMALLFSRRVAPAGIGLALLSAWLGASSAVFSASETGLAEGFPRVALVQTGWTQQQKWDPANVLEGKRRLFDLTTRVHREGAELVVWPETAWPQSTLYSRKGDMEAIAALATHLGVPILASSLEKEESSWGNSVSLVTPQDGFVQEYRKQRLVPIREQLSLPQSLETFLRRHRLVRGSSRYQPGVMEPTFELGAYRYAVMICYESTTVEPARELAKRVDFFVVVSNGATLYSEFAKEAHFRSAILRAAQTQKPVLQAGNDGVTGIIDGRGVVLARLPVDFTGPEVLLLPNLP